MYSRSSDEETAAPPYQLPRANGIAYAAQESWVLNDTIKVSRNYQKDIGIPHTPVRTTLCLAKCSMKKGTRQVRTRPVFLRLCQPYSIVLEQCALRPDISRFEAGDMTEVGEKGLTLR